MLYYRYINAKSGSVTVESAIVLPLFLFVIFGIIELGLILYSSVTLERIALDSARNIKLLAHTSKITEADVRKNVQDNAFGLINANKNLFIVTETTNTGKKPVNFSGPERCLQVGDLRFDGKYCSVTAPICPSGYFLEDKDKNNLCSGAGGASPGGAGSIVRYVIFYDWQILTPVGYLSTLLGNKEANMFSDQFNGAPTGVKRMIAGGAIRNEY